MKTNDLQKGTLVLLRSRWVAKLEDGKKGNTRLATVYGICTEMGSIYSHDIVARLDTGVWRHDIEYTPSQIRCRELNNTLFGG